MLESSEDLLRLEDSNAAGRELDRERQAVEPDTDVGDRSGIRWGDREVGPRGSRSIEEERSCLGRPDGLGISGRARGGQGERRDRVLVLARHIERGAARD